MLVKTTFPVRFVTLGLALVGLLVCGCGADATDTGSDAQASPAGVDQGAAAEGAAALGPPLTSLDEIASHLQATTDSCADARTDDNERSDTLDDIYDDPDVEPFLRDITSLIAGVGECTVSHPDGSTFDVEMVVFEEGSFADVQQAWKTHSTEGPPDSWTLFGNGYTIHGIEDRPDIATALGVMYLRCGEDDALGGQQIPADVDGCHFTTVR